MAQQLTEQQLAELDKRLHNPNFSMAMFLSKNETFSQVYNQDQETLQRYGITCKQIGDRLETLRAKVFETSYLKINKMLVVSPEEQHQIDSILMPLPSNVAPNDTNLYPLRTPKYPPSQFISRVLIENRYIISYAVTMGRQICPFDFDLTHSGKGPCGTSGGSTDYVIYDIQTGNSLRFSDLIIHLIKDHCFFEGNVPYRVDPENAIKVLDIQPGVNYEPQYKTRYQWSMNRGSSIVPNNIDRTQFSPLPYPGLIGKLNGDTLETINTNLDVSYPNKADMIINGIRFHGSIGIGYYIFEVRSSKYVEL